MTKIAKLHDQWMADPEYRAAYNALEDEVTRATIVSGVGPNGRQDRDGDHSEDNLLQQDQGCSPMQASTQYAGLEIMASLPETEIWFGDTDGYFVQKALGKLITRLLPGDYELNLDLALPFIQFASIKTKAPPKQNCKLDLSALGRCLAYRSNTLYCVP